jgi:hypothetical protein
MQLDVLQRWYQNYQVNRSKLFLLKLSTQLLIQILTKKNAKFMEYAQVQLSIKLLINMV